MTWAKEIKLPLSISALLLIAGLIMLVCPLQIGCGLSLLGLTTAMVGLAAVVQMLIFFRDPVREVNCDATKIISPADGQIVAIEKTEESRFIQGPALRIAIFMHVGNVHIQRMPIDGRLVWQKHYPGKYMPAFDKRAAKVNEQRLYAFERAGKKFTLIQIAGLLARRTICWLNQGDELIKRNTKIGMITLGSEIDLYLPLNTPLYVSIGDKVWAGQSIIGDWINE